MRSNRMASNSTSLLATSSSTSLPALSPSQRGPVLASTKSFVPELRDSASFGAESSCSTAASDSDSEKEGARDICSADIEWLLGSLSQEQKTHFDRSLFHRECQRIFRMMDKDDSGFLDQNELENVIALLIPGPKKTLGSPAGHHLMMSIQSVLAAFDKDSDRQLSSEEFPDFVRFCYAWKSQQERALSKHTTDVVRPAGRGTLAAQALSNDDEVRPSSRGRLSGTMLPVGAPHKLLRRSASTGSFGISSIEPSLPSRVPPKIRPRSASKLDPQSESSSRRPRASTCSSTPEPAPSTLQPQRSKKLSRSASMIVAPRSALASTRPSTPEPLPASLRPSKTMSRNASNPNTRSASSSRRGSKSMPSGSAASSRIASPEPAPGAKAVRKEDLAIQQMSALKALLGDLVTSYRNLPDLVWALLRNTVAPDGAYAFTKETLDHVCELVLKTSDGELTPKANTTDAITAFMQVLGHIAEDTRSCKAEADAEDTDPADLVNRALEVVTLLSLRWFALQHHMSLPEMSDYQRQKWLPPAFSDLVGQILWRHRTCEALQGGYISVVENIRWIASTPGASEDMINRCNAVFRTLSGSSSGHMKLSQWRKVMDLLASNRDLRTRARRCDGVRACYGDALSHSEAGLSRKQFKLMLLKTADLMSVHPIVLFREIASHADDEEEVDPKTAPKQ